MHKIVMHTEKSEENNKNVVSHTATRVKVVQVKKFEKVTGKPRISHLSPKSTVSMPKVLHWSLFFLSRFFVSFTRLSKYLSMSYALGWAKGYWKHTRKALTLWKPLVMFSIDISNCLWFGGKWAPSFLLMV